LRVRGKSSRAIREDARHGQRLGPWLEASGILCR
jgi:hypothetical protein